MSEIITFLMAVLSHWQGYVTGGVVTGLIYTIERLTNWKMSRRMFAVLFLGVFLLVSFFLAWRDRYREALQVPVLKAQVEDREKTIKQLREAPAQVQVNVPPFPAPIVNIPPQMAYMASTKIETVAYAVGDKIKVNDTCHNLSQSIPAEHAWCGLAQVYIVDTELNEIKQPTVRVSVQDKMYRRFEKNIAKLKMASTERTFGPGEGTFSTGYTEELLDKPLDDAFKAGTKTVLFTRSEER